MLDSRQIPLFHG